MSLRSSSGLWEWYGGLERHVLTFLRLLGFEQLQRTFDVFEVAVGVGIARTQSHVSGELEDVVSTHFFIVCRYNYLIYIRMAQRGHYV